MKRLIYLGLLYILSGNGLAETIKTPAKNTNAVKLCSLIKRLDNNSSNGVFSIIRRHESGDIYSMSCFYEQGNPQGVEINVITTENNLTKGINAFYDSGLDGINSKCDDPNNSDSFVSTIGGVENRRVYDPCGKNNNVTSATANELYMSTLLEALRLIR